MPACWRPKIPVRPAEASASIGHTHTVNAPPRHRVHRSCTEECMAVVLCEAFVPSVSLWCRENFSRTPSRSPHAVYISDNRSNQFNQCALGLFPEARHPSDTYPCSSPPQVRSLAVRRFGLRCRRRLRSFRLQPAVTVFLIPVV